VAQEVARLISGGRLERVSMFARVNNFGEQALIVSVRAVCGGDAVLLLPLPVAASGRHAFVDVGGYPNVFHDLDLCWDPSLVISDNARLQAALDADSLITAPSAAGNGMLLARAADVARIDAKLAAKLSPKYDGYAFAAFRLPAGNGDVSPLAIVFESRTPDRVFFPVADVNHGEKMPMHHRLYAQGWTGKRLEGWMESDGVPAQHVDLLRSKKLVQGPLRVYRNELRGDRKNDDVTIKV
jgi:hypothetical protein